MADAGFLELEEGASPSAGATDFHRLYVDSADGHLKKKDETGAVVDYDAAAGSSVSSFNSRTGAVLPASGDYTASQIVNVAAGGISATDVQTAINELYSEKLDASHAGSGGSAHSLVSGAQAGFMSSADKSKLDTVQSGSTANSSDSFLLSRSNHTGTQTVSTISDFTSSVDTIADAKVAAHSALGGSAHPDATTSVSGFLSASDKVKINSLSVELATGTIQEVHVNSGGNDTTGNGTVSNPYASVTKALSVITDATSSKKYVIRVGAGTFTEATLVLKPWVWIVGHQRFATRINVTAGNVTLDSTFGTISSTRAGIKEIYFSGSTGLNFDLNTIGGSGTPSAVLQLDKVWMNGNFSFTGRTQNIDFIEAYDCYTFGNFTADSFLHFINRWNVVGTTTINATVANSDGDMFGAILSGAMSINASVGKTNSCRMNHCRQDAALTLSGSGVTLASDAVSLPSAAAVTLLSGATLDRKTEGFTVKHTPTVSANFRNSPTNVRDVLQEIEIGMAFHNNSISQDLTIPANYTLIRAKTILNNTLTIASGGTLKLI